MGSRKMVVKPRQKAFDSTVVLGVWTLWLERNVRTFYSGSDSVVRVVLKAGEQLELLCRAHLVDRSMLFSNLI
jgi:hypothetical protein